MKAWKPLLRRFGFPRSRFSWSALPLLALFAWSCQLTKSEKIENTLSFDRIADTLALFDKVIIVLQNLDGTPLDTVFQAKVAESGDVKGLLAPHWNGGKVLVSITGIKGGAVVYRVDTRFDPATGTRDGIVVHVVPEISLSSTSGNLTLVVGDTLPLPTLIVQPDNLLDKTLEWSADPDSLVRLERNAVVASKVGTGVLTVRLKANPGFKHDFPFSISDSGLAPESLSIQPESLDVAANGSMRQFSVTMYPPTASSAVYWTSADPDIASVDTNGRVQGKAKGKTVILAISQVRSKVQDFARVNVTGPIPVTSVRFARDNLEILEGGGAESLLVSVEPPDADPSLVFTLSDSLKASLQKGKISGIAAGALSVIAASASNPDAKDTLYVKVSLPTPNDTDPPLKPKVKVDPIGPTQIRRPVWTWTSGGNGGTGNYQVSLDKPEFDSLSSFLSDTTFKPSVNLGMGVHVLYVRERDAADNWSLPGSAQVEIDFAGPAVPKIKGTSPTSALPRWSWSSGGGGGAGLYRSRLGDADFPANAPESADTNFTLPSAATGTTYTLFVQERDAAGNWSLAADFPIKYDLTKPTVTISKPQESGIFITASDTVTVSGTADAPNGIAKIEYAVDAGPAASITHAAGGSWSIVKLPVANARTTAIKVTATDSLGNKGEASLSILRDGDPPTPPVSLSTQTSPTNVATASWTWKAGSDGTAGSGLSGKYRWKLNAGLWIEVSSAAAAGVALAEGANTFSVQEEDKAGNWSASVTGNIVLDTKVPDAVTFTGTDSTVAATLTPAWAWTPSAANGGIGSYVLKLDGGSEFDWPGKTYTPATPLSDHGWHTLTVKEKDQVSGATGAAKTFTYRVQVGFDPSKPWGGLKNPPVKTAGCGKAATLASGKYTITSGGQERSYIIDIPAGYDADKPYRLVFCFHWVGGTSEAVQGQDFFFLKPLAAAGGEPAIFLAPQASAASPGGIWSGTSNIDHVLFDDILAHAKANLCIDSTRVFATGFSFGGMMTYSLSTNHQNQLRAAVGIAPTNYNIWLPNPIPTAPIAWMQTTGMSDGTVPWVYGSSATQGAKYIALQRGQDNGCTVPATIPTWQSGNHLCYDFSGCRPEFPAKACTFNGGHVNIHSDPGSTVNWIPEESWKFITQF